MIDACKNCENLFLNSQIGSSFPVLFETEEDGFCYGYTPNYTRIQVPSRDGLCGNIIDTKLIAVDGECCLGEI